jgi:cytochrome c oxidase subunit 1
MLFAIGFVSLFVSGGVSGLFLAQPSIDLFFHDTYFVVAHFHLIMGVAAIFGIFAATYFWAPKMFGRHLSEGLGKIHFWFTFIGVYAIFMPMHWLGMLGHPRRYSSTEVLTLSNAEYVSIHNFISIAAMITITAQLLFLFNFFWSLKKGKKAGVNPWNATTLEWTVPSPPPHDNFAGNIPTVNHGPYEFSVPGAPKDFILQSEAEAPAKKRG